ncbi:MAG: SDR family oxidoreductase [Candidatus Dormibacteria bacterium]
MSGSPVEPGSRGAVLITGASTGIGEATAICLAGNGFTVFAGYRKDADGEALRGHHLSGIRPLRIDVTSQESIDAAVAEVAAAVGPAGLAGLVNNAGISGGGPLEFTPMADIRAMFEVNVFGLIATTQAFMPLIRAAGGRVVCTGSISGRTTVPFAAPYSMTKAAVQSLCHALRVELRPWGIPVVCVEPGSIATPIWQKGLAEIDARVEAMPPLARQYYGELIPKLKRLTERSAAMGIPPAKVGRVVLHALTARHPRTRYLVGNDARAQSLLGRMPDRVRDGVISRLIGVTRP